MAPACRTHLSSSSRLLRRCRPATAAPGELRAATYGRGIWQIPLLTALSSAQPAISLNPTALPFGTQAVATISAPQTVTVTNSGSVSLTVSQVAPRATSARPTIARPLQSRRTLHVPFRSAFCRQRYGSRSWRPYVYRKCSWRSGYGLSLRRVQVLPKQSFSRLSRLAFPCDCRQRYERIAEHYDLEHQRRPPLLFKRPRHGRLQARLQTPAAPASLSNTGCTVSIAFVPTASGTRSGTLTITDAAGTQIASFTGIGTSPATDALSPSALTFAAQPAHYLQRWRNRSLSPTPVIFP